jgi:hypothetical protein
LRADVRDQIPLVISEPVLSKKILALRCGTDSWMGRKAELGHVLEKQKKTTVVCRPLPNDTASSVGPTAPVLPELRADVRDQIPRHFRTVLSKKILALQMRVPIPWMGKAELGHVLLSLKMTVVVLDVELILHQSVGAA